MRLRSQSDADAWVEFSKLYQPMVYRFARRRGLQDADARELVQNVMIGVAKAVQRWEPDRIQGRFRTFLFRIARNQWINMISKKRHDIGVGGTEDLIMIHAQLDEREAPQELVNEYRREVFRMAAAKVRDSFHPNTWQAFWRTSVLGKSIPQVAEELSLSVGAVHIARSRVTARLRETIQMWERNDEL